MPAATDRLHKLNPAQREAVTTSKGPLLVLAGAGTGKTRVITHRTAELIRKGVPPDRILSVTFTNKAAREMQERVRELLGRRLKPKPVISTFHAFCARVLRQEITALGYPADFSICDRGDQEATARTALRDIRINDKAMRPSDLLSHISRWKMAGVPAESATEAAENDMEFLAATAYRRYQRNLRSKGAVDFDDLLLLTHRLFREFPEVLQRHQQRFAYVQIDEYQDTNAMQFALVEALVRPHENLCVVGDDDQSIYGWRGADVSHILNFKSHFPAAKVVRLQENYRCTDCILELANRLVRHNVGRHEKRLIPTKRSPAVSEKPGFYGDIRFREFADENAEAESVALEIKYLVEHRGVPAGDVAVLFRTNEQPRQFETEFRRQRIPYTLIGGQSFFERREIRDMLAYLKVLAHPDDESSLLRIINTPARGIGETTVEKLLNRAVREGRKLWDVVPQAASAGVINAKTASAIDAFRELLARYRRRFEEAPRQMDRILQELIEEIDYASEVRKQYKREEQQELRLMMLDQMVDSVKHYRERTDAPSLAGYLEETALAGREEESDKDERLAEQAVKLMTLHSAKGLEFPRVYLVGLEEGLLPHHRALSTSESAIDEERRLAYVGITRAMDHLTITRAASRRKWGKRRPSTPSRFLFEMRDVAPAEATEPVRRGSPDPADDTTAGLHDRPGDLRSGSWLGQETGHNR